MCTDFVDAYNVLSPVLSKIELLCRLSPLLDSDREYSQTLVQLLEITSDYAQVLRRTLDDLATKGGRP
jgi:hypothetical protein